MKRLIFIVFVFIIVAIIVAYFLSRPSQSDIVSSPGPSPTLLPSVYRGVDLEEATAESVVSSLGPPLRTITDKQITTYIYSTANPNLHISVEVNNDNSVRRVMEPTMSSLTYSKMISSLGTPQLALYGTLENLGFRLFVYPEKGVAVLANSETDEAKMRWYFPRMSQPEFLKTLGEGYSTTYDPRKQ